MTRSTTWERCTTSAATSPPPPWCCGAPCRANPESAEAHCNLGRSLLAQNEREAALHHCDEALRLRPGFAEAWNNRGNVFRSGGGDLTAAAACYEEAIRLQPDFADAWSNLGATRHAQNDLAAALRCCDEALRLRPGFADAHLNRSLALLTQGDLAQGWAEYEWRPRTDPTAAPARWTGEPLEGRTILIHAEQGIGDTFQFVRYLPLVRARSGGGGGEILLACQPGLMPMLQGSGVDADRIVEWDPNGGVDGALTALSRLRCARPADEPAAPAGTDRVEAIPAAVPYLRADAARVAAWRARLAAGSENKAFTVGIVWAGNPKHRNDHNRSCALAEFAPLARVPGVRLFSLQRARRPRRAARKSWTWIPNSATGRRRGGDRGSGSGGRGGHVRSRTSPARSAARSGRCCRTSGVALAPEPRRSPWYPSMRLFRQEAPRLGRRLRACGAGARGPPRRRLRRCQTRSV
jgi:hypothetical protein